MFGGWVTLNKDTFTFPRLTPGTAYRIYFQKNGYADDTKGQGKTTLAEPKAVVKPVVKPVKQTPPANPCSRYPARPQRTLMKDNKTWICCPAGSSTAYKVGNNYRCCSKSQKYSETAGACVSTAPPVKVVKPECPTGTRMINGACGTTGQLGPVVASATHNSITIKNTPPGPYDVRLGMAGKEWVEVSKGIMAREFTRSGLNPNTTYYVTVSKVGWRPPKIQPTKAVTTECPPTAPNLVGGKCTNSGAVVPAKPVVPTATFRVRSVTSNSITIESTTIDPTFKAKLVQGGVTKQATDNWTEKTHTFSNLDALTKYTIYVEKSYHTPTSQSVTTTSCDKGLVIKDGKCVKPPSPVKFTTEITSDSIIIKTDTTPFYIYVSTPTVPKTPGKAWVFKERVQIQNSPYKIAYMSPNTEYSITVSADDRAVSTQTLKTLSEICDNPNNKWMCELVKSF